ncbi:helix-turn-helix domain-containing protein [Zavarzinia compransoris]|uniref:helix-turn-helix domain-containing protein n=1 Tax=Zavarzinia marina TaxID=2911065 RepID=UPI001F45FF93|nr:helix-turn-helix domain-containing protein [Zavarzinia marina]MCF4166628.1 helix-turn-helix domain-containing protein [Zavarzinia marina]
MTSSRKTGDAVFPVEVPGLDAQGIEDVRRLLDLLDVIAVERQRLHGGDEQGAVMRLLVRQLLDGDASGMPLLRLSRLTGIPRETLRRKIGTLLNRGYLVQDEAGRYHAGAAYFRDSVAARQRTAFAIRSLLSDDPT